MIERFQQTLPHGITLSCRAAGQRGRPVLMFLHGFPEAAFVWDGLLEHFALAENGGYRCVAPNLRGFEQSTQPADVKEYRAKYLVQDIAALIQLEGAPLECLVAHDWGGAVAWNMANQLPHLMKRLAIINSPHPGTFLRELQSNPKQQAASAYMNFLIRPDAEHCCARTTTAGCGTFFTNWGGAPWLTETVKTAISRSVGRQPERRPQLLPRLAAAAAARGGSGGGRDHAAARNAHRGPCPPWCCGG